MDIILSLLWLTITMSILPQVIANNWFKMGAIYEKGVAENRLFCVGRDRLANQRWLGNLPLIYEYSAAVFAGYRLKHRVCFIHSMAKI